jgi:hypothetical protein
MECVQLDTWRTTEFGMSSEKMDRAVKLTGNTAYSTKCKRRHNKEVCDLCTSPFMILKCRRLQWAKHVAKIGKQGMNMKNFGGETCSKVST